MSNIILQSIIIAMFGWMSFYDIKNRKISMISCLIFGTCAYLVRILWVSIEPMNIITGISIGIILIVISYISKGQIGIGDGIVVLIVGGCVGFANSIYILLYGLLYAAIFAIVKYMITGKSFLNRTIPFIPFLFGGYLTVMLISVGKI